MNNYQQDPRNPNKQPGDNSRPGAPGQDQHPGQKTPGGRQWEKKERDDSARK